ncbi:hypothetical protein ACS0TY_004114 [Phlomoides rotata]
METRKQFASCFVDGHLFYSMDLDQDGRLCNVLWIHPRCRAAYEEFHDVLSFDTTYLVNRYKMPFASIVGVNHHRHSILLGCAFVTHGDAESFRWIFQNWLQVMNGVHPNAIITDQCPSINLAIRNVMPNTTHRLTIENFETRWAEFLVKYHLDNNVWLIGLYEERAKWVLVYLHETFWAGMISTQRSEGMHAYFDEFVHSRSTLK